jgi:S-disulfanyl-L-cysteine oxidoreductase SoxD
MIKTSFLFLVFSSAALAAPSVWDGVFTAEQAARGKKLYTDNCTDCHDTDLKPVDDAKPLIGEAFLKAWNLKTVGRLIDTTKRTMPPDTPNTISRKDVTDMVAYLLSMNGFPAGKAELDPASPLLKEIVIEPKK